MANKSSGRGVILLAEDRQDDALLLKRAFKKASITNPVVVVPNGNEALSYLKGEGVYSSSPLPILLLLDLKMPCPNGFDVLQWVRRQPSLKALRVIVLTISESIHDVNRAYQMGANSFLIKSTDFREMILQAEQIKIHWIDTIAPEICRPASRAVTPQTVSPTVNA